MKIIKEMHRVVACRHNSFDVAATRWMLHCSAVNWKLEERISTKTKLREEKKETKKDNEANKRR